jgi:hypothetical protein
MVMISSSECIAKAIELEAAGPACANQDQREGYACLALGWRRTALLALAHEEWSSRRIY